MPIYKVTACWYEVITIFDAEDEDAAISQAEEEMKSTIHERGMVDDFIVEELVDEEDT